MTADRLLSAEDPVLLLMDDDGASVQGAGTSHPSPGGALLTLRVLEGGDEPDARTAAVIGLRYGSGSVPSLRPPLPWTTQTGTRAQVLQRGGVGHRGRATAMTRTAAAIAASSDAAAAITVPIATR